MDNCKKNIHTLNIPTCRPPNVGIYLKIYRNTFQSPSKYCRQIVGSGFALRIKTIKNVQHDRNLSFEQRVQKITIAHVDSTPAVTGNIVLVALLCGYTIVTVSGRD